MRGYSDQHICQVEPREGRALRIHSVSRRLFANDNQAATWRPLVESLHQRLARLNPPPQFVAGVSPTVYALHIGAGLALVVIALVLASENVMLGLLALVMVGLLGTVYWWRHLRLNRPRPYDPLALPPVLLPVDRAPTR